MAGRPLIDQTRMAPKLTIEQQRALQAGNIERKKRARLRADKNRELGFTKKGNSGIGLGTGLRENRKDKGYEPDSVKAGHWKRQVC